MLKELIDTAVVTHGHWKIDVREAIEKGVSIYTVETLRKDDACAVGQWLHSLPEKDPTEFHKKAKELHAVFHQHAADVLAMAFSGRAEEAKKTMNRGGVYYEASANFVRSMLEWKEHVA